MSKKSKKEPGRKTSVYINRYYLNVIQRELETERFSSIGQVIMEGLRLLEKEEYQSEQKRKKRIKYQLDDIKNNLIYTNFKKHKSVKINGFINISKDYDNSIGDLAKDIIRDKNFPYKKSELEIFNYLNAKTFSGGTNDVFKLFLSEYNTYKHEKDQIKLEMLSELK